MASLIVSSGIISSGLSLLSGDVLSVLNGGEITLANVGSGAQVLVSSGGLALGTQVGSGGAERVVGGLAVGADVASGGVEAVVSGGNSNLAVVNGLLTVASGAATSGALLTGGTELVSSGGSALASVLTSGGNLVVLPGGTAIGTVNTLGNVVSTGDAVLSNGNLISAVGTLTGQAIGATESALVLSGGQLVSAAVTSGGVAVVFGGGTARGLSVTAGALELVSSGGTVTSDVIGLGGTQTILSGGVASGAVIGSGGLQVISNGGIAVDTTLLSGGTLDLAGLGFASGGSAVLNPVTDVLTVTEGGVSNALQLAGNLTGLYAHIGDDGHGGTDVTLDGTPCYCRGTSILTDRGPVAVEALRIGDCLVTAAGPVRPVRWIGQRSYAGAFAANNPAVLPIRFRAGCLADGVPHRDLLVSPLHAMFLHGVLIPARALVDAVSVVQLESVAQVDYFHVELDTHDVILAEGAPAESFVDDQSRGMFQNAAEYRLLYPAAPQGAARYCAPRLETGPAVDHARRAIAARHAGIAQSPPAAEPITTPAGSQAASTCQGCLDSATRTRIAGWAWDAAAPDQPLWLLVLDNGRPLTRVLANRYRADLVQAGVGDGCHGFDITIPGGLSPLSRHIIQIRCERDGMDLTGSPAVIARADSFDADLQATVAAAVAGLQTDGDRARVLSFIAAQADRLLQHSADAAAASPGQAARPRALVIDSRLPVLGRDSGSQAILSHMASLRRLGYQVHFIAANEMDGTDLAALEAGGVIRLGAPLHASVEDVLRRQPGRFDVVYLHRADVAARYLALARFHQPHARILYSVADLHHLRLARQAAVEQRPDLAAETDRIRLAECMAAGAADAVITHSATEQAIFTRAVPQAAIHCVGFDVPRHVPARPLSQRSGIAFIGSYAHTPNVDAARYLVEQIMPLVWAQAPAIGCALVGSDMPDPVRRLARPGVRVLGRITDLGPGLFDDIRLTVAPLRFGAGIKGKVLESFAAGTPCIMSDIAAEGLLLCPTLRGLVGEDAAALAAHIIHLHRNDAAHTNASTAGAALIDRHCNPTTIDAALAAAIRSPEDGAARRARALP